MGAKGEWDFWISDLVKNPDETDKKDENKLAGPLAKNELPAEGRSRRNGKREEGSRQKISDDRQHHDKWTVRLMQI